MTEHLEVLDIVVRWCLGIREGIGHRLTGNWELFNTAVDRRRLDADDVVNGWRVRVKDIEIEPTPEAQKLRQWKTNMIETISDSCPQGFSWISELEAATCFEQLEANP
jgi:hypothetical protein